MNKIISFLTNSMWGSLSCKKEVEFSRGLRATMTKVVIGTAQMAKHKAIAKQSATYINAVAQFLWNYRLLDHIVVDRDTESELIQSSVPYLKAPEAPLVPMLVGAASKLIIPHIENGKRVNGKLRSGLILHFESGRNSLLVLPDILIPFYVPTSEWGIGLESVRQPSFAFCDGERVGIMTQEGDVLPTSNWSDECASLITSLAYHMETIPDFLTEDLGLEAADNSNRYYSGNDVSRVKVTKVRRVINMKSYVRRGFWRTLRSEARYGDKAGTKTWVRPHIVRGRSIRRTA